MGDRVFGKTVTVRLPCLPIASLMALIGRGTRSIAVLRDELVRW